MFVSDDDNRTEEDAQRKTKERLRETWNRKKRTTESTSYLMVLPETVERAMNLRFHSGLSFIPATGQRRVVTRRSRCGADESSRSAQRTN